LKQRRYIVLILLWAILLAPVACGKKGPPFLAKKVISKRVEQLNAEWRNGGVVLKGQIVEPKDQEKDGSNVTGCIVYHALFALEKPPCEGCPIEYRTYKNIEEEVIAREGFSCRVPEMKKRGIHFFKVRLIGQNGEIGPSSNRAKLIIDDLQLNIDGFLKSRHSGDNRSPEIL